jgi:hypothetical protein
VASHHPRRGSRFHRQYRTPYRAGPTGLLTYRLIPGGVTELWSRTGCSFDTSGSGSCRTGDCGAGVRLREEQRYRGGDEGRVLRAQGLDKGFNLLLELSRQLWRRRAQVPGGRVPRRVPAPEALSACAAPPMGAGSKSSSALERRNNGVSTI